MRPTATRVDEAQRFARGRGRVHVRGAHRMREQKLRVFLCCPSESADEVASVALHRLVRRCLGRACGGRFLGLNRFDVLGRDMLEVVYFLAAIQ